MNVQNFILACQDLVQNRLVADTSGHDWDHTLRVSRTALSICKHYPECDPLIVELGALFHDIADHKFGYSDHDRQNIILSCLDIAASQAYIEGPLLSQLKTEVVYIANHISFKGGNNQHILTTLESQIVQDADRLDALGAIGIARTFTYGGYKGRPLYTPAPSDDPRHDSIYHFYEKLLLLKDLMHTEVGKSMAQERHDFMCLFLDQFYREWQA